MLKADGFDEAVLGVAIRCSQPDLIVYDYDKCIKVLMREMSQDEAVEYMDFNVTGAWVGEGTPLFLIRKTLKEIDDDAS